MSQLEVQKGKEFIHQLFYNSAVPSLMEYIKITNLSRSYDPQWNSNHKLEQAADHIKTWIQTLEIRGLKSEIIHDQGYSPLIFTQIEGDLPQTFLFYGHYDKQPPFTGWEEGLGPNIPVIKNGKLYGRGGADDGYSTYGTMIAIKAVQSQNIPLPRCIMITQGDQQSGSAHMLYYIDKIKQRIKNPSIIFCLDSGTIDYDRFWLTNSLRGNLVATLRVQTLNEGVHSGDASGIVPSSFRIANILLNRIENIETGQINKLFCVDIPADRYEQNLKLSEIKGQNAIKTFPLLQGVQTISEDPLQCLLNRSWRPTLTVIGQNQLPPALGAGNVMLPAVQLKFSIRMPPTLNSEKAVEDLKQLLTKNVPYGAHVELINLRAAKGWNAPKFDARLEQLIKESSLIYFGNEWLGIGQGGSIPVIGKFSEVWPNAQFIITGVLGPNSNAHGPNEFLHLQFTQKLINSMAFIVAGASGKKKKESEL